MISYEQYSITNNYIFIISIHFNTGLNRWSMIFIPFIYFLPQKYSFVFSVSNVIDCSVIWLNYNIIHKEGPSFCGFSDGLFLSPFLIKKISKIARIKSNKKIMRRTTGAKGCYFLDGFLLVSKLFITILK